MRALAALLAWLFIIGTASADCFALILMQPAFGMSKMAGRGLSPASLVLWPPEIYKSGHSGLLSLVTGENWLGSNLDTRFSTIPDGRLREINAQDLERRGYFRARRRFLGDIPSYALAGPQNSFRETALLLATEDSHRPIRVLQMSDPWPTNGLVVCDTNSWNEISTIMTKTRNVIVVQYPPADDQSWTCCWLSTELWKGGEPSTGSAQIPGLLPAKALLNIVLRPDSVKWISRRHAARRELGAWLDDMHREAPKWLTAYGLSLAFLICLGLIFALRERQVKPLSELLLVAILGPASAVLAGNLAKESYYSAIALGGLYLASKIGQSICRRWIPDIHRLFAPAVASACVFTFANPLWSPLSGVFRMPFPVSASGLGCWFASLVAVSAFARNSSLILEWLIRAAIIAMTTAGFAGKAWWAPMPIPFGLLPLLALAFGDGLWRPAISPILPMIGAVTTPGLLYGVAWKPGGLIIKAVDADKLNGLDYVAFLISPLFVGTIVLVFIFSLMADRFILHQYRRLVAIDPRRLAVFSSSLGLGLIALTQPFLLPSALWCCVAGLTILVIEGLYTL